MHGAVGIFLRRFILEIKSYVFELAIENLLGEGYLTVKINIGKGFS